MGAMKKLLLLIPVMVLFLTGCETRADREFKHNLILDQQMIDRDERALREQESQEWGSESSDDKYHAELLRAQNQVVGYFENSLIFPLQMESRQSMLGT